MELIGFSVISFIAVATSLAGFLEVRRANRTAQLVNRLQQYQPLFLNDRWTRVNYALIDIASDSEKWGRCTLLVTHKRIAIYPYVPDDADKVKALHTIQPNEIRGFWRPVKYTAGENTLWIHAEINSRWLILKVKLYKYDMQALIRAMKDITTEDQITAYRRRRPYIHRAPTTVFPATQTLTGAWELGQPVQLYLMPLCLVIQENGIVRETIPLSTIQEIGSLKRMEGGKPKGLIRFFVDNELRAFALDDYEAYATDLAEASKRTLEEPVTRKRKSKDDDFEEDE
ncbi:MAG: hypothetical protein AAF846_20800 [Chloroflexota bacterium]